MKNSEAWEGFDLLTINGGINPLLASYTGAPHQARGVDPAPSAAAAFDFWTGLSADAAGPGSLGISDLPTKIGGSTLAKQIGFGAVGSVLAIVLIAIGLLVVTRS